MAPQDIIQKLKTARPEPGLIQGPVTPAEDENVKYLISRGISPDVANLINKPDPETPLLEQLYKQSAPKPAELSEKGMKAGRSYANLADAFGVIADMTAGATGAHVRERNVNQSATQALQEQQAREKNKAEKDNYDRGLMQAQYQDATNKVNETKNNRAYMIKLLANRDALLAEQADKERKYQMWLAEMGLKANAANRRAYEADKKYELDKEKVNIARAKANKEDKETKDKFTGIVVNARPDDPKAEQDATGNKVIKYKLTKDEVLNVANKAKKDSEFMKRHPELMVDKNDIFGTPHKGLTDDNEIAWTYLQEQYDNSAPATTPQKPQQPTVNTNIARQGGTSRARLHHKNHNNQQ